MSTILEFLSATVATAPMLQSHLNHTSALTQERNLHAIAIEQNYNNHREMTSLHIESSRKESARDQWTQKTTGIQTLMIITTLMIGGTFAIIIEGDIPHTNEQVIDIYSATLACAVVFLSITIWMSMKIQSRISKYVIPDPMITYECGHVHTNFLGFYHCHCRKLVQQTYYFFYCGTACMLTAAAILMYTKFLENYHMRSAANIFVIILGIGVILWWRLAAKIKGSPILGREHVEKPGTTHMVVDVPMADMTTLHDEGKQQSFGDPLEYGETIGYIYDVDFSRSTIRTRIESATEVDYEIA